MRRPPSSDEIVVYCEMANVWNRLFLPALLAAFGAIACIVTAYVTDKADPNPKPVVEPELVAAVSMAVIAGALLFALVRFHRFRPAIGVND